MRRFVNYCCKIRLPFTVCSNMWNFRISMWHPMHLQLLRWVRGFFSSLINPHRTVDFSKEILFHFYHFAYFFFFYSLFFEQDILTKHKSVVAEFLEENYDEFFPYYSKLLRSENYVTKRQSVKVRLYGCLHHVFPMGGIERGERGKRREIMFEHYSFVVHYRYA